MRNSQNTRNTITSITSILVLLVIGFLVLAANSQASAQTEKTDDKLLALQDTTRPYDLLPYAYITKDKDKSFTYRQVIENHLSGKKGKTIDSAIITTGSSGIAHWIVLPVKNFTSEKNWALSFGKHLDGRNGIVENIFVYDNKSRKRFLDTVEGREYGLNALNGSALLMSLEEDKEMLLVIYIEPKTGVPTTLVPKLMPESLYIQSLEAKLFPTKLMNWFFIGMIGFFIASVFLYKMWSGLGLSIYYITQLMFFNYQNNIIYTQMPLATELYAALFTSIIITALFVSRYFLKIASTKRQENKAIILLIVTMVLTYGIGIFIIPATSIVQPIMLFAPGAVSLTVLVLIIIAYNLTSTLPLIAYAISWLLMLLGIIVTTAALTGIIQPSASVINAYWYSLVPQGILLIWASMMKCNILAQERAEKLIELNSIGRNNVVKQSKESAENAQLLKVIEHERQDQGLV